MEVASRYSQALYEVIKPEDRSEIADTLTQVKEVLTDAKIKQFISHPKTSLEAKRKLFLSMGLPTPLERFLLLVLEKGREPYIAQMAEHFQKLVNQASGKTKAVVRTALPLDEQEQQSIKQRLEAMSGKQVTLEIVENKSLWGGIVIEMDGKIIDASLATTLNRMKQQLIVTQ